MIGANIAICLVALGVGAVVAPLPFGAKVLRYGLLGLPVGAVAVLFGWDGRVSRFEGLALVACYVGYVALIWWAERQPPGLGETGELAEAAAEEMSDGGRRVGRELGHVLAGLATMVVGATLLVDGVRHLVGAEADQVRVSLTIVGFATGFELVVLAWSAARRGISEVVVAGVVGSFAYNATMTLGVAALVKPLRITDAGLLHLPMVVMVGALAVVLALAGPARRLDRARGLVLLACYPAFVVAVLLR